MDTCCIVHGTAAVCVLSVVILITLATPEPRRANAPKGAEILSLSAARSRIEGFLQTAWTDSCRGKGKKGGERLKRLALRQRRRLNDLTCIQEAVRH